MAFNEAAFERGAMAAREGLFAVVVVVDSSVR